eukprot:TRINITY_DN15195_c0_g1_i1.p1 TRINITY_DN15195_c0_g1~~TRINITY_DN15195_c0_g1_i1.p1  ORF type:complete len:117 (-),score=3.63 TRINITY_DN15195_c0_g1_i1:57-407(-)
MPEDFSQDYVISARQDLCSRRWILGPEKSAVSDGDTFWSNEVISVVVDRELKRVDILVDGQPYAHQPMAEWMLKSRIRITAFLPHQAMILRLVQPSYTGPTHARVVEVLTLSLIHI